MLTRFTLVLLLFSLGVGFPVSAQTGISIDDAIRMSQEHSYGVAAARYDSLAGHADLRAAKAARFPSLNLNAVTSYIDDVPIIELPIGSLEAGTHDNYQADFRLALPLYTGGKITGQIRVQNALAKARAFALSAKRLDIAYQTRRAYLGVMAARATAAAAKAALERVRLINQDVQNLYASGLADSSDIFESQLALEKAGQAFDERTVAAANAVAALARYLGLAPDTKFILGDSIPKPNITPFESDTERKITRPETAAQEALAQAANNSIGLARAGFLPTLSVYGGYSVGKPNRNFLEDVWNDYWTAGANLTWNFNLGGQAFSAALSARNSALSAKAVGKELEESLSLQASVLLENLRLAFRSYGIAEREYDIAKQQYRLGSEKQRAGALTINRLLELETDLTSMEQLFHVSLINFYLSKADYLYAIGSPDIYGGF